MKTTIVSKEVNEEIDWSKPQWVIGKDKETQGMIIFTNGNHNRTIFYGTCLPCDPPYSRGGFSTLWTKKSFCPIPKDGLTIHIQND